MKRVILFGMTVLLLASSLALFSCGDNGVGNNNFTGTWITSELSVSDTGSKVPATLHFGASDWTLTIPSLNRTEKGTYTLHPTLSNNAYIYYNDSPGAASISGGQLAFVHQLLASGSFTKQ